MIDAHIDWGRIARVVDRYQMLGYRYIEVPWIVRPDAAEATCPRSMPTFPVATSFGRDYGCLPASGEQSLLHLMLEGALEHGHYVCVTPCFRDEDDGTHQPWFAKVELMEYADHPELLGVFRLLGDALTIMRMEVPVAADITVEHTETGSDLYLRGLEVGSYGIREHEGHRWAYGTGLAEPRFSLALQRGERW